MSFSHCPSEEQLRAFLVGKLPEPLLSSVAEHLETCSPCEALAQRLERESDAILSNIRVPVAMPRGDASFGTRPQIVPAHVEFPQSNVSPHATTYPFLAPPLQHGEIGRLGHYRVLRLLGSGGMGYVFHAEDLTLGRPVALKVMKPDLGPDAEGWSRFLREGRLMAAIKHEHLATIYQAKQEGGVIFLAMELLQGESLETRLLRPPRPDTAEILRLAREIAAALVVIHAHDLIHRDIKPANIWLEAPGEHVKLIDFGLARPLQDQSRLTQTGAVVGTPAFMAPEQAAGETVDPRSDLFSLGAVLYRMCTGVEPFRGENVMAVLTALAVQAPRPVRELAPTTPRRLADLIIQLLAKRPEQRPASAAVVIERLRAIEAAPSDSSAVAKRLARELTHGRPLIGAVLLLAVAIAGAAALVIRSSSPSPTAIASLPVAEVKDVRTYINSWKPIASAHWPLPLSPKGENIPNCYAVISARGKVSPHGIGLHPSFDGPATVSYALGKKYAWFQGAVSLNDTSPRSSSALIFTIYGDGRELWKSAPVWSAADTQEFKVSVRGVEVLKLEAAAKQKAHGAHGIWLEPFLTP